MTIHDLTNPMIDNVFDLARQVIDYVEEFKKDQPHAVVIADSMAVGDKVRLARAVLMLEEYANKLYSENCDLKDQLAKHKAIWADLKPVV
jgi:hypothetical protein